MRGPPVVLTNTLGRPVTNIISERGAVPMTVVNTLGEPVTLVNSGGEPVTLFNANGTLWDYPFSLFANNEQGAWYDPSDFSTLYQDSTGTTPVTAVEQPVGLMLDRSRGLVLGANIAPTITSESVGTGSISTVGGTTTVTSIDGSNYGLAKFAFSAVAGAAYEIKFTLSHISGVTSAYGFATGFAVQYLNTNLSTTGNYTFIGIASGASPNFTLQTASNQLGTFAISAISIKLLPGNHALQATSVSRPVLRSRYNLLTYSEELNNAIWTKAGGVTITANAIAAPTGATTADYVVETATTNSHQLNQSYTYTATAHTWSAFVKPNGRQWCRLMIYDGTSFKSCWFDVLNGIIGTPDAGVTATLTALSDGWYRPSITYTCAAGAGGAYFHGATSNGGNDTYSGDITKGYYVWGAQILSAADQTSTGGAYQRIAAATDYDVSNPVWRPYLAFDGVDDFFNLASAISITTDMTVVRGFGRSAAGIRSIGLGTSGVNIYDGYWFTDNTTVSAMGGSGAVVEAANTATGSFVFTSRRNASTSTVRRNGTQIGSVSAPSVINSFGAIGLMNVSYNNGPIYGLIVLDRELTGSELTATEQWMAGKTGVTL